MESLWTDLINSDWRDHRGTGAREDRISNDDWLRTFLARGGWQTDRLADEEERESLRRLRTLLLRIVDEVRTGRDAVPEDRHSLNRVLAAAPVVRRLEQREAGTEVVLEPEAGGIDRVKGEVAAAFATMLAEGDPTRIKFCANPDCGWVMYDSSRNRSRRWCDKTECGNLIKVRRHRRKKRQAAS